MKWRKRGRALSVQTVESVEELAIPEDSPKVDMGMKC